MEIQPFVRGLSCLGILLATLMGCDNEAEESPSPDDSPADEGERSRGRLLVTDGAVPELRVVDLDHHGVEATLSLASERGMVYGDRLGRYGWVVHPLADLIEIALPGLIYEQHGDHYHIDSRPPSMHPSPIAGPLPVHFVHHDDHVALFFDGTGTTTVVSEQAFAAGLADAQFTATSDAPHHGVAVLAGSSVIVSLTGLEEPAEDPWSVDVIGVTIRDKSAPDAILQTFDTCPGLHGEASAGPYVAFGCADGVMLLRKEGDTFVAHHIAAPAGAAERVGSIIAHESSPVMVGNFGSNALALIDPNADTLTTHALPDGASTIALFPFSFDATGTYVLLLDSQGRLHRLNPQTLGPDGAPLELLPPFDTTEDFFESRPALAVGLDRAYVSDPRGGTIHVIDVAAWTVNGAPIAIGGQPHTMAVVAGSPDWFHLDE